MKQNSIPDWDLEPKHKLRRYLFGELSSDELQQVEEQYFADSSYYQELLLAEDELIDAYLHDELTPIDHKRFEEHFLVSPDRREKLQMARTMFQVLEKECSVRRKSQSTLIAWSIRFVQGWHAALAFPKPIYAALGLLILLLATIPLYWQAQIKKQFNGLEAERESLAITQKSLESQVAQLLDSQTHGQRSRSERLEILHSKPVKTTSESGILEVLELSSGVTRSSGFMPKWNIDTNNNAVRLKLPGNYPLNEILAVLQTVEGKEIFRWKKKDIFFSGDKQSLLLHLPAPRMQMGDYILILRCRNAQGNMEDAAEYVFRAMAQ
jgi:hypothetical protein